MTMDKGEGVLALEVERFSKLGTSKLQQGQTEKALEAYRNAVKCSQGLGKHGYLQRACAFNLGAMLISMRKFTEGISYLNQAVPPEGFRDGRSNGDLYFNFGLAYDGLKKTAECKAFYEKALEEYKAEQNNVKMEAETIHRLGQLCVSNNQFAEAEAWNKQLVQAYSILGNKEKSLHAQAERANIFLKVGRVEDAEDVADDCLKGAKTSTSPRLGNVYNELGLVYTQMTRYDKALECYKYALALVESGGADIKLSTVLYQNLGALYNFMGRFEDAVDYHQMAANKHAELKNRRSQGHCFINMGFAYSQLKDMDKAGECFLHALQAARDCGDTKSEWQSFEALGSVAFQQNSLKRAQDYYKQSLATLAKSPEAKDIKIQDRIVEKLSYVIQVLTQKSNSTKILPHNITQTTDKKEVASPVGKAGVSQEMHRSTGSLPKEGSVIAVKRGSVVKYLKVRRSGTLRRFRKVALGLDLSPEAVDEDGDEDDESVLEEIMSAVTISEVETGSESNEEEDEGKKPERSSNPFKPYHDLSPQTTTMSGEQRESGRVKTEEDSEDEEEDDDDEDDDKREMRAAMRKVASSEYGDTQPFTQKSVADIHRDGKPKLMIPENDDDDEEDSESETEDEESDDSAETDSPPPVPTRSPEATVSGSMRTYEKPSSGGGELHYESIDHKPPPGLRQGDSKRLSFKEGKAETSGTIYETIRPASRMGLNTAGVDHESETEADDERESKGSEGTENMSKAEREKFLYDQFKASQKKEEFKKEDTEDTVGDQKNSKHCIVM